MTAKPYDVVVVGELNPDLILSGGAIPEFNQVEKVVDRASLVIGSSSAIFAGGAASLGLRVAFIGKVGSDLFGDYIRQSIERYGINTRGIVVDDEAQTGISVILSTEDDRAILTYPGTISLLRYADIDQEIVRQARHLHISSYYLQECLRPDLPKLFDEAHNYGLSASLDTNFDPQQRWNGGTRELLGKVDLFLPNALECQAIAGVSTLEEAIDLTSQKVKYLGVKLGKNGAILRHADKEYRQGSIQVRTIDSIGAGDSFDAGFVYAYLAGWEPQRILKFANICAGLSTRRAGGTAAQPTLAEAIQYLNTS